MESEVEAGKRLLIYVHFNPQDLLSSHVLHTLEEIRSFFKKIIFVSNSPVPANRRERLLKTVDEFIERENLGFDFAAWRDTIQRTGWEEIGSYDNLVLMNDSCFGPLFELDPIFEEMDQKSNDYWGITSHTNYKRGVYPFQLKIPEHLQSYFMCFKQSVIQSKAFREFWEKVEDREKRQDVIDEYEIGLTQCLKEEGYTFDSYITPDLSGTELNNSAAFLFPDHMIKKKTPFLKVKSFFYFSHTDHVRKLIQKKTIYDFELIEDHITKTFNPNKALSILNKNHIPDRHFQQSKEMDLHIAIHLHAYNTDVSKFFHAFKQLNTPFDLFITTDTKAKKDQIKESVSEYDITAKNVEIEIHENRGRDVLPWLYLAERLNSYDLVGHFHVKKSSFVPDWVGESWVEEIIDSLILRGENLFELFTEQPELGIVIPDVPFFFKTNQRLLYPDEEQDFIIDLWNRLDTGKVLDKEDLHSPVMSYGNMYWYRPEALKPLLRYDLFREEFPVEPIPLKNTLAHQIERLPVYVAWSQNYDFRIILDSNNIFSGFDFENKSGINKVLEEFKTTPAWKIGRAITWLPGKVKRFVIKTIFVE